MNIRSHLHKFIRKKQKPIRTFEVEKKNGCVYKNGQLYTIQPEWGELLSEGYKGKVQVSGNKLISYQRKMND